MKTEEYNQALKNAKIQGVENCKAILIEHHKKGIEHGYPLMNELERHLKLIQRTNMFYKNCKPKMVYKEYAETLQHKELTANEITEMENTWTKRYN